MNSSCFALSSSWASCQWKERREGGGKEGGEEGGREGGREGEMKEEKQINKGRIKQTEEVRNKTTKEAQGTR